MCSTGIQAIISKLSCNKVNIYDAKGKNLKMNGSVPGKVIAHIAEYEKCCVELIPI
jgi:hypothetical protein